MTRVKTITLVKDEVTPSPEEGVAAIAANEGLHQRVHWNNTVFNEVTVLNRTTEDIYVGIDRVATVKGEGCRVVLPGQSRNIINSGYVVDILGSAAGDVEVEVR